MFIGQEVAFTRTNRTFTLGTRDANNAFTASAQTVGALHFSQTGHTAITITSGSALNETFSIVDGWNLVVWGNVELANFTIAWTGTGSITDSWANTAILKTDIDLSNEQTRDRPRTFTPTLAVPRGQVHGTDSTIARRFAFEWRFLNWDKVDVLEEIFDRHSATGDPEVVLIPDGFEDKRYDTIITSPFNFSQSVPSNFNSGASGALIFETTG